MASFSTLDSDCINRTVSVDVADSEIYFDDNNFDHVFDITRSVQWIKDNGYKKVCLQLPDHLLPQSVKLCRRLKKLLDMEVYILADTTYNSCCIDEVAAQHIGADAILHYGHSCLSPHTFPVLDVYEKQNLDIDTAICNMKEILNDEHKVVLFYDVSLHHLEEVIIEKYFKEFPQSYVGLLPKDRCCAQRLFGRVIVDKENHEQDVNILKESHLVFIGKEGPTIYNLAVSSQAQELYLLDSKTCCLSHYSHSQWFKRRRYLIEKCKDARNIGVLVCTLSMKNYNSIIKRIKQVIRSSGKKCYTVTVGKPNVAKLANLSEIELFVLVACPENDLYNCRDFHSPIIYPYELEVALNPKRNQYENNYTTDFNELLPEGRKYCELEENGKHAPDVSLITGNLRNMDVDKTNVDLENVKIANGDLQLDNIDKNDWAVQELGIGRAINVRTWKGLDQDLDNSKPELATIGRKGIASGYDVEPF